MIMVLPEQVQDYLMVDNSSWHIDIQKTVQRLTLVRDVSHYGVKYGQADLGG